MAVVGTSTLNEVDESGHYNFTWVVTADGESEWFSMLGVHSMSIEVNFVAGTGTVRLQGSNSKNVFLTCSTRVINTTSTTTITNGGILSSLLHVVPSDALGMRYYRLALTGSVGANITVTVRGGA